MNATNVELSAVLISKLVALGVRDFAVCAGARNAPLVKVLAAIASAAVSDSSGHSININYFFDERAAGFFSLGRAKREANPVAVVTTSGTAVAELLPSAVESYYSGVPLIFLTADRPTYYRGSGAPQAIEQVGIFSHYVSQTFDISNIAEVSKLNLKSPLNLQGPTHINVCFEEPLIDANISDYIDVSTPYIDVSTHWRPVFTPPVELGTNIVSNFDSGLKNVLAAERVQEFLNEAQKPLVIVSELSDRVRSSVFEILRLMQAPVYLEAQSNLRGSPELGALSLQSGAQFLNCSRFRENFDSVIRLGAVPTLRMWRDLDDKLTDIPVLSVSELPFSGLAREHVAPINFSAFLNSFQNIKFSHAETVVIKDRLAQKKLESELRDFPQSEPSWFRVISEVIPNGSLVMLGNSLPIREWDLAASHSNSNQHKIFANRGANGIDGLLSTFLGLAEPGRENWLILGDLSALYDLNALAMLHAVSTDACLRIVVINNQGGQIFKPMFNDKNFLNEHKFEFSKWAEMFGLKYMQFAKASGRKRFKLLTQDNFVIEIQPDNLQSEEFWGRL